MEGKKVEDITLIDRIKECLTLAQASSLYGLDRAATFGLHLTTPIVTLGYSTASYRFMHQTPGDKKIGLEAVKAKMKHSIGIITKNRELINSNYEKFRGLGKSYLETLGKNS